MRNAADRRRYGKAAHSLLPMEGGAPKGAEVGFLSGMKKWETALLSFRHPEHSRGIFFVCRFLFPVYIHLHETPCFQVVGSAVFLVIPLLTLLTGPQTKKISRFRSK